MLALLLVVIAIAFVLWTKASSRQVRQTSALTIPKAPATPTLTTCVNCGGQISTRAARCPHCQAVPLDCAFCHKPIRTEDVCHAQDFYSHRIAGSRKFPAFHRACLAPHFEIPHPVRCPDCNVALASTSLATNTWLLRSHDCPNCGAGNPLKAGAICYLCGRSILRAFQSRVRYNWGGIDDPEDDEFAHTFCDSKISREEADRLWSPRRPDSDY